MPLCNLCPRRCNALRTPEKGEGFCKMGTLPVVARAARHMWEEPCISGTRGSGTVFFSGCTLGCVFCQNERISHHPLGEAMDAKQLCELFERVEALQVHNLNLVTPSHFAPEIFKALKMRKMQIPVVWNTSGYENVEVIEAARGLVDIFLPDLKYATEKTAAQLAGAPDYFPVAMKAIRAMCDVTGAPVYDADGIMQKGTIVRHLILPLRTAESIAILDAIAAELPEGTPVIACGHHPLLPAERQARTPGAQALVAALQGVKLYLCGHDHGFATVRARGLQQITTGQPHAYPGWAGLLEVDPDGFHWRVVPLYDDETQQAMRAETLTLADSMARGTLKGTPFEDDEEAIRWFTEAFDAAMSSRLDEETCRAMLDRPAAQKWRMVETKTVVKSWILGLLEGCPQDVRQIDIE